MTDTKKKNISPFLAIGLVFLANGLVMSMTLGIAIGVAFLGSGITFLVLGITQMQKEGQNPPE